jgi:hypothetical protein
VFSKLALLNGKFTPAGRSLSNAPKPSSSHGTFACHAAEELFQGLSHGRVLGEDSMVMKMSSPKQTINPRREKVNPGD